MSVDRIKTLEARLEREHRARTEAEHLLEKKSDELYELLTQVRSNESLLRNALGSMREGFLLTNQEGNIILINQQLKDLYPELTEHNTWLTGTSLQFKQLTQNNLYISVQQGSEQTGYIELTTFENKTIAVNINKTTDNLIATTHRDITHLKQAEKQQQQLLLELFRAQRLEAIGKMAGMIAHDFNNIIASIQGYAGFLKEDAPPNDNLHNSIDRIQMAADKAEQLIKSISNYSHEQNITYHDLNITQLLKHCCDLTQSTFTNNISLHIETHCPTASVSANNVHLDRAFMNLLSNARNAIGEQQTGHIQVSIDHLEHFDLTEIDSANIQHFKMPCNTISKGASIFSTPCVKISILDNGNGMHAEVIQHIFELYYTANKYQQGSGIGMFNTANIIADHGGGINVYSTPEEGTLVEVLLPLSINNLSGIGKPSVTDKPIMIIDDDVSVGEMLEQILQRNHIPCVYFSDAQLALDAFISNPNQWQLIISDQIMPELTGTDILTYLRDNDHVTPFILCSGHIDNIQSNDHLRLANAILNKPVSQTTLLAEIKRWLPHLNG